MPQQAQQEQRPPDPEALKLAIPHVYVGSHEGKRVVLQMHPNKILRGYVHDAATLKTLLRKYESNVLSVFTDGSIADRRNYIEWVRPALRFYCRQFDVQIPEWLERLGPWEQLPAEEHTSLFGPGPLRHREFRSWGEKQADDQRQAAAAEQAQDQKPQVAAAD